MPSRKRKQKKSVRKEQQVRKIERKARKEGMRCYSEKSAFPRRGRFRLSARMLKPSWQAEEGGEGCWHPEQRDRDLASCRGTGIAPQPFFPPEALMGALCTGKDILRAVWLERRGLRKGDLNSLGAQQAHAGSAMLPPTPILPEQGSGSHRAWMQQNTDPARFCCLPAMPLALLSQRTPATLTDASGIDQPQAAISLAALFGGRERLLGGAAQGPIRLKHKVLP